MKKLALLLSTLLAFSTVHSQDLVNTKWLGTNFPSPNIWFYFGTDTLYYSMTGSNFTPLSLYVAQSGEFKIVDLPGASFCTDTGHYTYAISGTNLTFNVVSDNCSSRMNTLVNYNWMELATVIDAVQTTSAYEIYPNPTDGIFSISSNTSKKTEVMLLDISGKKVYDQNFEAEKIVIDITLLPVGIYFGQCLTSSDDIPFIIEKVSH